jgi:pimeloyl-ACP methyl ester carboxylesterase
VPQVNTNGVALEAEILSPPHGLASQAPVLLIMGLGMQLTAWPDALVQSLLGRGYTVLRFDNRDIGLSTKRAAWGRPRLPWISLRQALGLKVRSAYSLDDMAADTVGMLDALSIPQVHVVGISMGGMIGQILAARYATRVASFTCIMSSSGARSLPGPTRAARRALLSRPTNAGDVESILDHYARLFRVIGSPAFPSSVDALRAQYRPSVERSYHPLGSTRQLVAIVASGDRSALLPSIMAPTTIIHGSVDPLIPVAAARDLAKKIPHADLRIVEGMGHDLPSVAVPIIVDAIDRMVGRAS